VEVEVGLWVCFKFVSVMEQRKRPACIHTNQMLSCLWSTHFIAHVYGLWAGYTICTSYSTFVLSPKSSCSRLIVLAGSSTISSYLTTLVVSVGNSVRYARVNSLQSCGRPPAEYEMMRIV
jgi:hypothetical protein